MSRQGKDVLREELGTKVTTRIKLSPFSRFSGVEVAQRAEVSQMYEPSQEDVIHLATCLVKP